MAAICTASVSPNNCAHRTLTVELDGETFTISDVDVSAPLSTEEKEQLIRLGIRRLRATGVTMANFLGRVTHGDEATNVKSYSFFGPGAAITKTNIGAVYVNICPGLNGERKLVDFTGCTQFRPIMTATLTGTGPFGLRMIRDSDDAVLFENALIALTGQQELDPGWQTFPAWAQTLAASSNGQVLLRVQAKSIVAADDPVFRRCEVLVR